jgi:NAD(P)-dependent dehydrogenase (short-subunit alcohol dehydrogenase family)
MPLQVPDISRNLFDLSGYCSIVTGAGQGIGIALAEALAYAGSDLVLTERNAEHLEIGASKIEAIGRKVTTVACDVAADDTPDRLVKAALDLSSRIDVLINNAAFMTFADMLTVEDAVWDNVYAVNVRAPMRIMRAVLPEMVKAERGSVINIGSSWSSRASVFNQDGGGVDYCSSKAALQSLTRAAAQDVAAKGVRVVAADADHALVRDAPLEPEHGSVTAPNWVRYRKAGSSGCPVSAWSSRAIAVAARTSASATPGSASSADFASVAWPSTPSSPECLRRRNTDKHAPAT